MATYNPPLSILRPAIDEDNLLLFMWRNDPEISKNFYSQQDARQITPIEHLKWWKSRNTDWRTYIIVHNGKSVGVLTFGQLDSWRSDIGIYIGDKSLWGCGIGKDALTKGLAILAITHKYAGATILDKNERSKRLFMACGFERIGIARDGESQYQKKL
jgi:RimJ/RimL family protein N-acetyltransferase